MSWTNVHRANRAAHALAAYRRYTGDSGTAPSEDVTDLLCDLRHYCDRHGLCPGDLDRIAHRHYAAERAEEGGASCR